MELLNALFFTNVVPHWVPKSVTNITLYCILFGYALQLAAGAFRLLHPWGDSSYPWVSVRALGQKIWVKIEHLHCTLSLRRC